MYQFFIQPENITKQDILITDEQDINHIKNVLRMRQGEKIALCCEASGKEYICSVEELGEEGIRARIEDINGQSRELPVRITLFQGLPKGDKMELIIQKAVELGAARIVPFFSRFCVAAPKKEDQKNARYARIAAEAAKQAGRGVIPAVELPLDIKDLPARFSEFDLVLFFYEGGGQSLRTLVKDQKRIALITGAEGGFSPEEAEKLIAAGAVPVGLGPRILRCETAPVAALAAVMTLAGQLE